MRLLSLAEVKPDCTATMFTMTAPGLWPQVVTIMGAWMESPETSVAGAASPVSAGASSVAGASSAGASAGASAAGASAAGASSAGALHALSARARTNIRAMMERIFFIVTGTS